MTREKAIEILRKRQRCCKVIAEHANEAVKADELREVEAIDLALAALRGPTREMVKRMRGEWRRGKWPSGTHKIICGECGEWSGKIASFCPACGAPMTDEAVDMMLERWKEALEQCLNIM